MDPKVCGKLLTHHRRGYGVDVEALRDRFPLRQIVGKGPRWDLMGTEGCGSGKVVSWLSWMFLGYKGIYRRKKYVGGAPWGPRGRGRAYPLGAPSCLVAASRSSRLQLQVFWIAFGPRKIIAKVSFCLDSVWYLFCETMK